MISVSIDDIPNEILTSTFGFLDVLSLLTCEQVCLLWSVLSNQSILWKNLCLHHQKGALPLIEFKLTTTATEGMSHAQDFHSAKRRSAEHGILHMGRELDWSPTMKRKGIGWTWKHFFLHFHKHGWFVSRWIALDKDACIVEVVTAMQHIRQLVLRNAALDQAFLLWLHRYNVHIQSFNKYQPAYH